MSEALARALVLAENSGRLYVELAAAIVASDDQAVEGILAAIRANQTDINFELGVFREEQS